MSRIKTDLKPTVKSLSSLISTSPNKKNESSTKLPPVSLRTPSASRRSSQCSVDDVKWTVDMVRGFTIQNSIRETERPRVEGSVLSSKYSESRRTSKDYERLYQKYLSLQKLVSQLREELKVKHKATAELQEKLNTHEAEYEQNLKKNKEIIAQHEEKIETFYEQVKELKEIIMERTKEMDSMKNEVEETKTKCDKRIQSIIVKTAAEMDSTCQRHKEELASRDSKLSFLKMQLESALKDNSKERQRQLDELTKELTRVTDETEMLKTKLRALNKQKQHDKCRNCTALEEALESKLRELRNKDGSISELLQHCQKMAIQLSRQDEFLKLCERSNVKYQPK